MVLFVTANMCYTLYKISYGDLLIVQEFARQLLFIKNVISVILNDNNHDHCYGKTIMPLRLRVKITQDTSTKLIYSLSSYGVFRLFIDEKNDKTYADKQ